MDRGLAAVLQLHRDLGPPLELPDCPVLAVRGLIGSPHCCFLGHCDAGHFGGVLEICVRSPKCAPTGRDTQRPGGARLWLNPCDTAPDHASCQ